MKNPINMKTQANLVKITRFEAFALYKYYQAKAKEHKENGATFFAELYQDDAQKWLDIATEIEATNADKVNELLAG
jgi:hypothetical protein